MLKRGAGHVEAILSFVIFIGFISTALVFFTPKGGSEIIDSTLNYAVLSLLKNISVDLESYSVKIYTENVPSGQNTIAIEFPTEISTIPPNFKARAETYNGRTLSATRNGNVVYVNNEGEDFVVIRFSEDINENDASVSSPSVDRSYYTVASSSSRKVVSEKRLLILNDSYYKDYETVRDSLNIPGQVSFGFSASTPTKTIIAETDIPSGLDVYSSISRRELLIQEDGALSFGELGVKIW